MYFHVLPGCQILVQTRILEDDAKALAHFVAMDGGIESVQLERSAGGPQQGREHFYRGRLAGAVWSEKRKDFPALDLEGNVVHRGKLTKTLDKVLYSNHLTPFLIGACSRGLNSKDAVSQ